MKTAALAEARREGGRITGAHSASEVGLSEVPAGVAFKCGTCMYMGRKEPGHCDNPHPKLQGRKVEKVWCCNNYWHHGMKVIV